jgi:hypothetical protein
MAIVVFYESVAVFLNRLKHSFPYSLSKSTDNSVVVVQILLGSFVMVSDGEDCRPQIIQELCPLLDVV